MCGSSLPTVFKSPDVDAPEKGKLPMSFHVRARSELYRPLFISCPRMIHSAIPMVDQDSTKVGDEGGIRSPTRAKTVVQLVGLPPHVTPADIRRMAAKNQVDGGFEGVIGFLLFILGTLSPAR